MFGDIFKGRYELYHPPVADGNTNACLLTGKSEYSAEEVKTLLEKSCRTGILVVLVTEQLIYLIYRVI